MANKKGIPVGHRLLHHTTQIAHYAQSLCLQSINKCIIHSKLPNTIGLK